MITKTYQVPLDFEGAQVRRTDPITSKKASGWVQVSSMRRAIIGFVKFRGQQGATTFEIANDMGVPRDYISPHIKWLVNHAYLYKTGQLRMNPTTKSKAKSEVYSSFNNLPMSDNALRAAMFKFGEEKRMGMVFDRVREAFKRDKTILDKILKVIETDDKLF